ncbi:MAG: biotin--[acetyl-CoA-carboxylase] ligase [Nitrospinota bacterium]
MTGFAEEVRRHRLQGRESPIYWYASIGSTNDEAFRLEERERIPEGTAVIADAQTQGKGRSGRNWFSAPGAGLYLSVLLRPAKRGPSPFPLTLVAGVAVATALERQVGRPPRLKWPNDLRYEGLKVGGILTEARANPDRVTSVVVGIGINLSQLPEHFPPDLRQTATSVAVATGRRPDRAELAAKVLDELDAGYRLWLQRGLGPVAEAWRRMASTLGRKVRAVKNGIALEGLAEDLAEDGSLVIQTPAGPARIQSGEVTEVELTECSS